MRLLLSCLALLFTAVPVGFAADAPKAPAKAKAPAKKAGDANAGKAIGENKATPVTVISVVVILYLP